MTLRNVFGPTRVRAVCAHFEMASQTNKLDNVVSKMQYVVKYQSDEMEPLLLQTFQKIIKKKIRIGASIAEEKCYTKKLDQENEKTIVEIETCGSNMDATSIQFMEYKEKYILLEEQAKEIENHKNLMQTQYEKVLQDLSVRLRNTVLDYDTAKLQNEAKLMTNETDETKNTLDNLNGEWNQFYQQFYMPDDSLHAIKQTMKNTTEDEDQIPILLLKEKELNSTETQVADEISNLKQHITNQEKTALK